MIFNIAKTWRDNGSFSETNNSEDASEITITQKKKYRKYQDLLASQKLMSTEVEFLYMCYLLSLWRLLHILKK